MNIPNYDDIITTPPDDPKPLMFCDSCGCELYAGDEILDIGGGEIWCRECVEINMKVLEEEY